MGLGRPMYVTTKPTHQIFPITCSKLISLQGTTQVKNTRARKLNFTSSQSAQKTYLTQPFILTTLLKLPSLG